ncbi:MAG: helix-turn-helix domain-containing protein [Acidobacteria bacterium]|nr:helix-turn-helix domain-containing protein [Acidobacteriota bacterium]
MAEETDKTFGELIQEAIKELGWSNAELARRTDFSPTHIGNLIRDYSPGTKSGKPTRLPADTVDRIADALKKPRSIFRRAAGLLSEDSVERPNEAVDKKAEAARMAEMVGNFMELPPDQQATAIELIKVLKDKHPEALEVLGPKFKIATPEEWLEKRKNEGPDVVKSTEEENTEKDKDTHDGKRDTDK